jgi:hypothetical protein
MDDTEAVPWEFLKTSVKERKEKALHKINDFFGNESGSWPL